MKKILCCFLGMLFVGACASVPTTSLQVSKKAKVSVNSKQEKVIQFTQMPYKEEKTEGIQVILHDVAKTRFSFYVRYYNVKAIVSNDKTTYDVTYVLIGDKPVALKDVADKNAKAFKNDPVAQEVHRSTWKRIYTTTFKFEIEQQYFNTYQSGASFKVNVLESKEDVSFEIPAFYIQGVLDKVEQVKTIQKGK